MYEIYSLFNDAAHVGLKLGKEEHQAPEVMSSFPFQTLFTVTYETTLHRE
jgi:hypothetical protein